VPEEAEFLSPELAFGALGEQLPTTKDLEYLSDVKQVLFQRRRMNQAVVEENQRAPAERSRGAGDPCMEGRGARLSGEMLGGGSARFLIPQRWIPREVQADCEGLVHDPNQ
jgi:hypothetical protein